MMIYTYVHKNVYPHTLFVLSPLRLVIIIIIVIIIIRRAIAYIHLLRVLCVLFKTKSLLHYYLGAHMYTLFFYDDDMWKLFTPSFLHFASAEATIPSKAEHRKKRGWKKTTKKKESNYFTCCMMHIYRWYIVACTLTTAIKPYTLAYIIIISLSHPFIISFLLYCTVFILIRRA